MLRMNCVSKTEESKGKASIQERDMQPTRVWGIYHEESETEPGNAVWEGNGDHRWSRAKQ